MGLSVLIVDECKYVRDMMKSYFETADVGVTELYIADTNTAALTILAENKVDLVFYDFDSRELNDFSFLYHLFNNGKNENYMLIPVVSIWIESRIHLLRNIGLENFLKKPFSISNLKNILSDFVPT
ncbi:MAG: hypothetical protein COA73_02160 [Candidatus Hydrogenedentota bacterium]|nr:MAG: hypothetical protein COA73_02160 [Candidatus Hydrogenedentota bacterium]